MMNTRPVLFALAMACAFSAPTLAQTTPSTASGMMMMKEGVMTMVMPNGQMSTMPSSDKMMSDMMMKDGKSMTGAHMMMMSGGKVYMMEDKKMSDGRMMSEHMTMNK